MHADEDPTVMQSKADSWELLSFSSSHKQMYEASDRPTLKLMVMKTSLGPFGLPGDDDMLFVMDEFTEEEVKVVEVIVTVRTDGSIRRPRAASMLMDRLID